LFPAQIQTKVLTRQGEAVHVASPNMVKKAAGFVKRDQSVEAQLAILHARRPQRVRNESAD
jgi:hypothetical protein